MATTLTSDDAQLIAQAVVAAFKATNPRQLDPGLAADPTPGVFESGPSINPQLDVGAYRADLANDDLNALARMVMNFNLQAANLRAAARNTAQVADNHQAVLKAMTSVYASLDTLSIDLGNRTAHPGAAVS